MSGQIIQKDEPGFIYPANLPEDHPLRNTPLIDLGAEFRHVQAHDWRPLEPDRPLAKNTFNTLYGPWMDFCRWRFPASNVPNSNG
jgi:hypothetical protein